LLILFCIIGFAWDNLGARALLALFCLCNFFSNFGPNTTTFIVPGECFPTQYRATAHGISAAAGKTGSIISQVIYNGLKDHGGVTDGFVKHVMQIYAGFMCSPVRHMMLTLVGYVGLVYPF
jgi:PHS family inorganic phosphate transporter-like MFS transporter